MNRKVKLVSFLWIGVLLLSIFSQLLGISSLIHAEETTEFREIATSQQLKLEGKDSIATEDGSEGIKNWTLRYHKQVSEETQTTLQLKVTAEDQPIKQVTQTDFIEIENGWIEEVHDAEMNTIEFQTAIEQSAIQIQIKLLDEQGKILEETAQAIEFQSSIDPSINGQQTNESTDEQEEIKKENDTTVQENTLGTDGSEQAKESEEDKTSEKEQTADTEAAQPSDEKALPLITAAPFAMTPLAGSPVNVDPFNYVNDALGTYPEHSTNNYTTNDSSTFIKNYDFSTEKTEGTSSINNIIDSNPLNFTNGYHDYGDGAIKKIVIPTSNPNQFKVQLDVIGDALETNQPIDISLVLDKSSSMVQETVPEGMTRWVALQDAVTTFANDLLGPGNDGNIRLGLAAFGSTRMQINNNSVDVPYGEIGKFGSSGFTTSPSAITSHTIYTATPDTSGTPTYLGLDAGYAMLTNPSYGTRSEAAKVLIVLTDGEPTFSPNQNYLNLTNNLLSLNQTNLGNSERYYARMNNTNYYNGNGTSSTGHVTPTVDYVNQRATHPANQNIIKYSIGFATGETAESVLTAIGKNGYFTANNREQLIQVLKTLSTTFSATLQQATVTDPMSDYVNLIGDVSSFALKVDNGLTVIPSTSGSYPSFAQQVQVAINGSTINLSNMNLGKTETGREGYRIEYLVEVKEAYRDGLFYPANKTTYVTNNRTTTPDYLHFAIPSVKVPVTTFDIQAKKIWEDESNQWNLREDITLQLQEKNQDGNWVDVPNQHLSVPKGATSTEGIFTDVVALRNGQLIEYRIIEKVGEANHVTGYSAPTYAPASTTKETNQTLTVTNTLLKKGISFIKVGEDHETPLAGAKFGIYQKSAPTVLLAEATSNDSGLVQFPAYPIGEYIIRELAAPEGYQEIEEFTILVKQESDLSLSVTGFPENNQISNQLVPFLLEFKKTNETGTPLLGATFTLEGENLLEPIEATSDLHGVVQFSQGLQPGEYLLKETNVPLGYENNQGPWKVVIGSDKVIQIFDKDETLLYSEPATFDETQNRFIITGLTLTNRLKDFTLELEKKDQDGRLLNGAEFTLTGPDNYSETIKQTDSSTFIFTGLRPGEYSLEETFTPSGFIGLTQPVVIVISDTGKVTIDGEEQTDVLTVSGNIIQLEVTNHAKQPLPETGGMTIIPYLALGSTLMLSFYIYLRRRGGRA
ncbi:SpaA isopeptide-forming pilin-related protein [Enterococcus thailandicus]|uniref:VWA domain-containing protein n=1 Tax=Enterococcus thailandicus TaxID=417368 RepID=A0A510WCN8_ENTTH|nr:SpaA isopeptide-forming pilin-related protein [Enterococcus thailandicus]OJG95915.1 hypothetical protein RV17_GL001098 [Enterococcus thailandicus]GEK36251.1 VWA domain-containing protein [Enterococcus thailandicus]